MRRIANFIPFYLLSPFCLLGMMACLPTYARAANEVAVEPSLVSAGRPVTLRWYFTGDKVVISGGRFGKGVVVTGRKSIVDSPKATTQYHFDVWYRPGVAPDGAVTSGVTPGKEVHVQYSAVAEVEVPITLPMQTYRHPNGWQINVLAGWRHDNVSTDDEGSDGLVYFQQEKDSVERIVVAIMPVADSSIDTLMKKITSDVYSRYDSPVISDPTTTKHSNNDAQMVTFTGMDQTHPGTKTQSVVLVFIQNGKGYIISGRTEAARFHSRQALLEHMMRSFTFVRRTAKSA